MTPDVTEKLIVKMLNYILDPHRVRQHFVVTLVLLGMTVVLRPVIGRSSSCDNNTEL